MVPGTRPEGTTGWFRMCDRTAGWRRAGCGRAAQRGGYSGGGAARRAARGARRRRTARAQDKSTSLEEHAPRDLPRRHQAAVLAQHLAGGALEDAAGAWRSGVSARRGAARRLRRAPTTPRVRPVAAAAPRARSLGGAVQSGRGGERARPGPRTQRALAVQRRLLGGQGLLGGDESHGVGGQARGSDATGARSAAAAGGARRRATHAAEQVPLRCSRAGPPRRAACHLRNSASHLESRQLPARALGRARVLALRVRVGRRGGEGAPSQPWAGGVCWYAAAPRVALPGAAAQPLVAARQPDALSVREKELRGDKRVSEAGRRARAFVAPGRRAPPSVPRRARRARAARDTEALVARASTRRLVSSTIVAISQSSTA